LRLTSEKGTFEFAGEAQFPSPLSSQTNLSTDSILYPSPTELSVEDGYRISFE